MASVSSIQPLVRLRCSPCEVAWSGTAESRCWVCGNQGEGLRTATRLYDLHDLEFDFDLI
jgi:hypothetical protein